MEMIIKNALDTYGLCAHGSWWWWWWWWCCGL